jgi:hypothetical protein
VEATYVLFAQNSQRARLREALAAQSDGPVRWRERKLLFGSEFYLTGPAAAARRAHSALSQAFWML